MGNSLLTAAQDGNLEKLSSLLADPKTNINFQSEEHGVTALMEAAGAGHLDVVSFLIDRKANVNITSKHGAPAIIYAATKNHFEIVDLLAFHGASAKQLIHINKNIVYDRAGVEKAYAAGAARRKATGAPDADTLLATDFVTPSTGSMATPTTTAPAEGKEASPATQPVAGHLRPAADRTGKPDTGPGSLLDGFLTKARSVIIPNSKPAEQPTPAAAAASAAEEEEPQEPAEGSDMTSIAAVLKGETERLKAFLATMGGSQEELEEKEQELAVERARVKQLQQRNQRLEAQVQQLMVLKQRGESVVDEALPEWLEEKLALVRKTKELENQVEELKRELLKARLEAQSWKSVLDSYINDGAEDNGEPRGSEVAPLDPHSHDVQQHQQQQPPAAEEEKSSSSNNSELLSADGAEKQQAQPQEQQEQEQQEQEQQHEGHAIDNTLPPQSDTAVPIVEPAAASEGETTPNVPIDSNPFTSSSSSSLEQEQEHQEQPVQREQHEQEQQQQQQQQQQEQQEQQEQLQHEPLTTKEEVAAAHVELSGADVSSSSPSAAIDTSNPFATEEPSNAANPFANDETPATLATPATPTAAEDADSLPSPIANDASPSSVTALPPSPTTVNDAAPSVDPLPSPAANDTAEPAATPTAAVAAAAASNPFGEEEEAHSGVVTITTDLAHNDSNPFGNTGDIIVNSPSSPFPHEEHSVHSNNPFAPEEESGSSTPVVFHHENNNEQQQQQPEKEEEDEGSPAVHFHTSFEGQP